jgi:hypothetical protein
VLFAKYNYSDQVEEDEMGRPYSTNGEKRNAYRTLVGEPEGKRPPGRSRRGWKVMFKRILEKQDGWYGMD